MSNTSLRRLLTKAIDHRIVPGGVAGTINRDGDTRIINLGTIDGQQPTRPNTIYDCASITKSIPTALLACQLVEKGILSWNDQLIDWLPEYEGEQRDTITLRDLAAFAVPFGHKLSALKDLEPEELWQKILHSPVNGDLWQEPWYINTTSILLGRVIERATDVSLDELAQHRLFEPLAMTDTSFAPHGPRVAPSEVDTWRGHVVHGEVHDESAWKLRKLFVAGSAGMFSTVPDLLKILHMLLQQGEVNGQRFLDASTIAEFGSNQFPEGKQPGGLGWELQAPWMGDVPEGTFGKTGFTGCCVVINVEEGVGGVLLSNATFPQRPTHPEPMRRLRQDFCESLF